MTKEPPVGVDDGTFLHGGPTQENDACDDGSATFPMMAGTHGDDEVRLHQALSPDNSPVVLRRAD